VKISVVTAVRNRAATIGHSMESVQAQTFGQIEHVIQDGCSTDGTLDVIGGLADGATHLRSERDGGIYDAINRGIARSTGDVVGLLHSDDFFADDHVIEKVAAAFADPSVQGVYGDLNYVSSTDATRIVRHWRSGGYHIGRLRHGWMPPHPTVYLRREVFEQWGLYDPGLQIAADYDAMLRYLSKGRIQLAYIPEVLVNMRTGGESNRSLGRILRKSREDYLAIRRNDIGGMATLLKKNLRKVDQLFSRRTGKS
jgi:glycosyltransferase involved in cell wall biosynthesis